MNPSVLLGLVLSGEHAPGLRAPLRDTFTMAHHALMAHGRAVQQLRANAKQPIEVGYAPTCGMTYPETDKKKILKLQEKPVCHAGCVQLELECGLVVRTGAFGTYPEEGMELYGPWLPDIKDSDMKLISQPIDIYGQNIYNGRCVRMGKDGEPEYVRRHEGFPKQQIAGRLHLKPFTGAPNFCMRDTENRFILRKMASHAMTVCPWTEKYMIRHGLIFWNDICQN